MTTKWKQKASTALVIITILCLFLFLILIWSALNNGMLRTTPSSSSSSSSSSLLLEDNQKNDIIINGTKHHQKHQQQKQLQEKNSISSPVETNLIETITEIQEDHQQSSQDKLNNEIINKETEQINLNNDEYITEEFIKPLKIHHLPFNTDDLLYESKMNNKSNGENYLEGYRITGNYRSKSSRIWDPHPEYKIDAFGHRMHLMLYQDTSFVPDTFKVTSVYSNRTEVHLDDHRNDIACHYRGNVLDDKVSAVAVSLCDGMTGHIKTSFGSFFIQPIEKYKTNNVHDDVELLHRIWCEPIKYKTKDFFQNIKNHHNCPIEDHLKGQNKFSFKDTLLPSLSVNEQQHSRKKRNIYNDHQYTLEVLIAVDKKMSEFHGEQKIKHYVLTLMSIVSNIFSDASIGNSINVAVINIMVLKEDLSLQYIDEGVFASHLLKKFCGFMQRRYDHYDTAILLTREQICRNTTETRCDTLGLAELGTVCKRHSCSIVQDNGLSAAFTIAHELGHILNMPHDDDDKCKRFERHGRRMLNIMSSTMGDEIHPWSWSDCSRHYVTEFLEQDDVSCMEDTPRKSYDRTTKQLPGEIYSLDQQCELIHGQGAQYCLLHDQKVCGRLWCSERPNMRDCRSSNLPWADGTRCLDDYHWCQKGECVHRNRTHLRPIDGGWGPWGPYSACSRTCGGGIQEQIRECNNPEPRNGGVYCPGNHKHYRSCQTQDCPPDSMDFREKQCFDLNGNNFGIHGINRSVKWIPKYGVSPKDECKLFCRIKGSNTYFQLADKANNSKVVDGTTCSFDSFNKCVNGICRPAGCDNVLHSNAKLDRCGVCEGNNDTCVEIDRVFYKSDLDRKPPSRSKIYYHVVTIPKGASNVLITQPGYPLTNYIVLLDDEGNYLINGDNTINTFSRSLPYAGVTIDYSGSNSTLERVNTTYARRLQKDLVVEVRLFYSTLFNNDTLNFKASTGKILSLPKEHQIENEILIRYSYTISINHPHYYSHYQHHRQHYQHQHPYQHHQYSYSQNHHINSYNNVREETIITYRWDVDQWNTCNALCGGTRYRNIICIQVEGRHTVDAMYCNNIPKPSYELQSSCNTDCEIIAEVSNVSECSTTCEKRGKRYKTYKCIQRNFHTNYSKIIDLSHCESKYPLLKEEDCIGPCANWMYTEWTPCSLTCSSNGQIGKQTRRVVCTQNGQIIDDVHCSQSRRYQYNDITRTCNTEPCPSEYSYSYGEDTPCSVTCGIGQRSTVIYCKQNNQIVDKILCAGKPMLNPIIRNCTMPPCINKNKKQRHKRPLYTPIQQDRRYNYPNHYNNNNNNNKNNPTVSVRQNTYDNDITSWEAGEWSHCNRHNCQRNRTVHCKDPTKYNCPEDRKPENVENCCAIKYVQKWSPCSVDCGIGIKRKEFICANVSKPLYEGEKRFKNRIDLKHCRNLHLTLPSPKKREKQCKRKFCNWVTGPWSECTCDTRLTTRAVDCKNRKGISVEQKNCDKKTKPEHIVQCPSCTELHNIRTVVHHTICSCEGRRRRRISCYRNNKHIRCPPSPEYASLPKEPCTPSVECLPRSCMEVRRKKRTEEDGDYIISIKKRPINIYCYNMKDKPKEYINLNSTENVSIYYDKRIIDINKCPPESRYEEYRDLSITSGSTNFNKIAIELDTLRVIEDDYTFATINGKPQPYGSAGDCYNLNGQCPQGYFSINLNGSGFKIKPKTKWETYGRHSTIKYAQKLEYPYHTVKAFCGGYCGSCQISKDTNLILDVV